VSDTPRTDAAELETNIGVTHFDHEDLSAAYHFARQLEREINAANELIVRLQAVTNDPHALWANWLRGSVALPVGIGDVREYQDRIKRLEEALDKTSKAACKHIKQLESEVYALRLYGNKDCTAMADQALKEAKL
jgi:uncharacterized protein Yka (UPF0111/DUF47 family)